MSVKTAVASSTLLIAIDVGELAARPLLLLAWALVIAVGLAVDRGLALRLRIDVRFPPDAE